MRTDSINETESYNTNKSTTINYDSYKIIKLERVLALFFRALKGEALSVNNLAFEYGVSKRSISRDISDLKLFLSEHRDALDNAELKYSSSNHCYTLKMDNIISNNEVLAITKVLIGARAFSKAELTDIIHKLKLHTTTGDKKRLENLIKNEIYHYNEIYNDCESIIESVWKISECIEDKFCISIKYNRMNRTQVIHKIMPLSIMFSEFYFYLIAYMCDGDHTDIPYYFRIDRIENILIHREHFSFDLCKPFNEGILRNRSQFMWPGKLRSIRFKFTGPSVQAILDRIPTAHIIERTKDYQIIEAQVYGDGIKMFLLSQGRWIEVLAPSDFVDEMRTEIIKMNELYKKSDI